MLKVSKSVSMLIGSVSLIATLSNQPANAEGFLKAIWHNAPDLGIGRAVKQRVKNKAEAEVRNQAKKIGKAASEKFHSFLYEHADLKGVDHKGRHVRIEYKDSHLVRNLVHKMTGVNLDADIPFVPSIISRKVNNYLEATLANYLEEAVGKAATELTTGITMHALGKAFGIAEDKISDIMSGANIPDVSSSKKKATKVDADIKNLKVEELSAVNKFLTFAKGKIKVMLASIAYEAANQTATHFITKIVTTTGERALKEAEVGVGLAGNAVVALVGGITTGGIGLVAAPTAIGAAMKADAYLVDDTNADSYFRRFVKWLTGYEKYSHSTVAKVTNVARIQINNLFKGFLDKNVFGLTEAEDELVNGKLAISDEEDEDGFLHMSYVERPYDAQVIDASVAVKEAVVSAAGKVDAFVDRVADMIAEPEHELVKKVREQIEEAEKSGDKEKAESHRKFLEFAKAETQPAPTKSWWKLW